MSTGPQSFTVPRGVSMVPLIFGALPYYTEEDVAESLSEETVEYIYKGCPDHFADVPVQTILNNPQHSLTNIATGFRQACETVGSVCSALESGKKIYECVFTFFLTVLPVGGEGGEGGEGVWWRRRRLVVTRWGRRRRRRDPLPAGGEGGEGVWWCGGSRSWS